MPPLADLDALAHDLQAAINDAVAADFILRGALADLAQSDPAEDDLWREAQRAHSDRLAAHQAVGEAVMAWTRAGGDLLLEDPVEAPGSGLDPDPRPPACVFG